MKTLYIEKNYIEIHTKEDKIFYTRSTNLHYGKMPLDTFSTYETDAYSQMRRFLYYSDEGSGEKEFFSKRRYTNDFRVGKIYEDELKKVIVGTEYKKKDLETYSIEKLKEDLNFMEFTDLIFDREHQLKLQNM